MTDDLLKRLDGIYLSDDQGRLCHSAAARIRELEAQLAVRAVIDREYVAFTLWKAEADRAAPSVGRHRTFEGFADELDTTRKRWLQLSDAVIAAINPALTTARNDALEEAAMAVSQEHPYAAPDDAVTRGRVIGYRDAVFDALSAIRALKEPKP